MNVYSRNLVYIIIAETRTNHIILPFSLISKNFRFNFFFADERRCSKQWKILITFSLNYTSNPPKTYNTALSVSRWLTSPSVVVAKLLAYGNFLKPIIIAKSVVIYMNDKKQIGRLFWCWAKIFSFVVNNTPGSI